MTRTVLPLKNVNLLEPSDAMATQKFITIVSGNGLFPDGSTLYTASWGRVLTQMISKRTLMFPWNCENKYRNFTPKLETRVQIELIANGMASSLPSYHWFWYSWFYIAIRIYSNKYYLPDNHTGLCQLILRYLFIVSHLFPLSNFYNHIGNTSRYALWVILHDNWTLWH